MRQGELVGLEGSTVEVTREEETGSESVSAEEVCQEALDKYLAEANEEGGLMSEFLEKLALMEDGPRQVMLGYYGRTMPKEISEERREVELLSVKLMVNQWQWEEQGGGNRERLTGGRNGEQATGDEKEEQGGGNREQLTGGRNGEQATGDGKEERTASDGGRERK